MTSIIHRPPKIRCRYRTCVIDGRPRTLTRRICPTPRVSNESPTLGLSHLQFEALLTAARDSDNRFDFALVVMLGLLGLRIFETCNCDIDDLGERGELLLLSRGFLCGWRMPPKKTWSR